MAEKIRYDETALLALAATGDEQAFRLLFMHWHQKLAGYVLRWINSPSLAEDIVQDVFLKIWLNRETLARVESFSSYIYVVSRNQTFNALKKMARDRVQFKNWLQQTEAIASGETLPQAPVDYFILIDEAVEKLPGQQRKVYELKYRKGMKYEQIGHEMGIAGETARKHMQSAIKFITSYIRARAIPLSVIFFLIALSAFSVSVVL